MDLDDPRDPYNLFVRQKVADKGIELTPEQLVEMRKEALMELRGAMRKRGYELPEDDEELIREMRRHLGIRRGLSKPERRPYP